MPETIEIIDALDNVPDEWNIWFGKIEKDAVANCVEWSQ